MPKNELLENCLLHFRAQLALKGVLHLTSILERNLNSKICEGIFGAKAREIYYHFLKMSGE